MTHHSSLIPRSSQLFKMVVKSNFAPWESLWMSKSQPMCALRSLIPLGCPTPQSWGKPLIGALLQHHGKWICTKPCHHHSDCVMTGVDKASLRNKRFLYVFLLRQLFDNDYFLNDFCSENGSKAACFNVFLVAELLPSKFW